MWFDKGKAQRAFFSLYLWVLLGLGLRLWRALLQVVMFRDETTYAFQIKHILSGTIFQDPTYFTFPPAFALFASPIALVTGDPELAGRLVSCVAGAATAIPAYYLARDLFGEKAAIITAALTSLFPPLMSIGVMSEPTYSFLVTTSLYLGNRAYNSGRGLHYFLFGLIMAVGYLARPEGFFIFCTYFVLLVIVLVWDKAGMRRTMALTGLALFGFFLLAFPYMLQIRAHFGRWEISGKTPINLAKARAAETLRPGDDFDRHAADVYEQYQRGKNGTGTGLMTELSAMMDRYPYNLETEIKYFTEMAGFPLLAFSALGLGFAMSRQGTFKTMLLPLAAFAPFLVIPAVFVLERIVAPYLPMLMVPAGYGVVRLSETIGRRVADGARGFLVPGLNVFFAGFLFTGYFGAILPDTDVKMVLNANAGYNYYYTLRRLGAAVKGYIPEGSKVITRNNIFAYYAGGEYLPIPTSDMDGLMKYARDNGARFLFYGPMEQQMRPQFYTVFFQNGYPEMDPMKNGEIKLVFFWEDFLLYEFSGKGAK